MGSLARALPACLAALVALQGGAARAARTVRAPLRDYVTQVRGLMPTEGSGVYVYPTPEDRGAFAAAAKALAAGDVLQAERALAPYPNFEVVDFQDGEGGPSYLAILERPPLQRGWGFFFFAQQPTRANLLVEAPHPLADRDSELAAVQAVQALRPAAFLLAGAHRYADPARTSDMAHTQHSIFVSVHEQLLTADRVVLQIHGFNLAGHQGYPDLLLSAGEPDAPPQARQLCDRILAGKIGCQLFDGTAYTDLGAQTNVQGGYAKRTFGAGHFLHFESAEPVREDPARFGVIVQAIADQWPAPAPPTGCAASAPLSLGPAWAPLLLLLARRRRPAPIAKGRAR